MGVTHASNSLISFEWLVRRTRGGYDLARQDGRVGILYVVAVSSLFFFFQAEDGIRDLTVTGVQTCALPILWRAGTGRALCRGARCRLSRPGRDRLRCAGVSDQSGRSVVLPRQLPLAPALEIGRASCRERV